MSEYDLLGGEAEPPCYGVERAEPMWFARFRVFERHAGALAALVCFTPSRALVVLCAVSYVVRLWGMEAVYHRYFAHRSYRAGRVTQFVLAMIGTQCAQRGPLWWTTKHRVHHRFVDSERDPHSPLAHSLAHAHFKWFLRPENMTTDLDAVRDFARYPELRWLNRNFFVTLYAPALALFAAGQLGWLGPTVTGLSALAWGFCLPSALALHLPSFVNSVGHSPQIPGGYQRYPGRDGSTNRPLLALMTLGTGWHNNHHRYAGAARAGFAWYEIDVIYYSLRVLAALGVIHDLRPVPREVLAEGGL